MLDSSGPETPAPGPVGTPAAPSDPLEELHRGGDSFLAAARVLRRGWSGSGKKTQWQLSPPGPPSHEGSPRSGSRGDPEGTRPKPPAKAPPTGRVLVWNLSRAAEDRDTRWEAKTDEGKHVASGGGAGRRPGPSARPTITYVWASGCRSKYRLGRRFKAPILPVILEV